MVLPDISRLPLKPQERVKQSTFSHGTPCATATNADIIADMYAAGHVEKAATEHYVAAADAAAAASNALNAAEAEENRTRPWAVPHVPLFDQLLHDANNLSISNSILYWASTCMPYVQHLPIEHRFVTQTQALLQVLDLNSIAQNFYDSMKNPGGIAATDDQRFNFWIQYSWLACFFAIRDQDDMVFVMDTPHSWETSDKHYWWSIELAGSPFYPAINTPLTRAENMRIAFADQYQAATVVAARAAWASKVANQAQESALIAAQDAITRAQAARAAASAALMAQ